MIISSWQQIYGALSSLKLSQKKLKTWQIDLVIRKFPHCMQLGLGVAIKANEEGTEFAPCFYQLIKC